MDEFSYTQADLSSVLGKSRSHLANILRLLHLPESVRELVIGNRLTAGHARALLAVRHPEAVAQKILERNLSVREVEEIAHEEHGNAEPKAARRPKAQKDPDTRAVEQALEDVLGFASRSSTAARAASSASATARSTSSTGLCRRLKEAAGR